TRTVDSALRTAGDFDSVDVVRREVGKIELTGEPLINRNAIEQDLHVLARQTAQENRGQLTGSSSLNDGKTRNFTQRVGHAFDLFVVDLLRINHRHAGRRLIERNIETGGGDDDRLCFRQWV